MCDAEVNEIVETLGMNPAKLREDTNAIGRNRETVVVYLTEDVI